MDNRFILRFYDKNKNKMIYGASDNNDSSSWVLAMCNILNINPIQCSGVEDKNKILIFDGDIVKRQNRYIGVVIFEKGCFKIKWQDGVYYGWARHIDDYQESSLEIIGNIYENPELLEDKNNG